MKRLALSLTVLFGVLVGFLVIRTLTVRSRQLRPPAAQIFQFDRNAIAMRLSEAVRFRTVSRQSGTQSNSEPFQQFHAFLAKSFPRIHAQLSKEVVNEYSLLYTWKGKNAQLKPILLMAHMDVVPVDSATAKSWSHEPFSGEIADGYIWGRGTMDDKGSLMAIVEAVEQLLTDGAQPERTVYLAFGHDEETGGRSGAAASAALLRSRGIEFEFVLDEGLNTTEGIIAGVARPVALIGIAEKGYLSLELTVESPGGHSSTPPARTAIGILSRAINRLENTPLPAQMHGPTRGMLEFLGAELPWHKKLVLANLWLFAPLVERELAKSHLTNALIRTTQAPTMINGGISENILPNRARAVINYRILPGDSIATVLAHARRVIDDPELKISPLATQAEPSPVSSIDAPSFQLIQKTIGQIDPEALVAPALLIAASDSRHYASLSKNIYKFLPIRLKVEDVPRYHGVNERISLADYERCVRFYAQVIRNASVSNQ